jgi:hypothetical protein
MHEWGVRHLDEKIDTPTPVGANVPEE